MDVDWTGASHDSVDDGTVQQLVPARSGACPEHDLRRVLGPRQLDQRTGDVARHDLAVFATQLVEQAPLRGHVDCGSVARQAAVGYDVHADQVALGALGDARRPAQQVVGIRRPGQRDDDPLAGLPRSRDPVAGAVVGELVVDAIGDPEQRQLTQRGQVAGAEVVGEGGVDAVRGVHVPVGQPAAQRVRIHVDQLDLICRPHDLIRHGLPLLHAGDALHHVVQRFEVLDVDGRDDADASGQQLVDVLPALGVARPGRVGVCQFVDEHDLRVPAQERVGVHLGERGAAVFDGPPRHDFEVADLLGRAGSPVGLDEAHHDVGSSRLAAATLVEHGVRLADAGRGPEVDAQRPALDHRSVRRGRVRGDHASIMSPSRAQVAIRVSASSIPSTSTSAASQTARRAVTLAAPSASTATSVPGSSSPPGAS